MSTIRRELWEAALQEGPRLRKLALLLLDYIDVLSAELDETTPIAHDHGWRSSRVAEGARLRTQIESYNSKVGSDGLAPNSPEKWPPLDPYTRVRTTTKKLSDKEWTPEALVARKWGVTGRIVTHHDSHGLCYDVLHDDGTEGCYDPSELEVLS